MEKFLRFIFLIIAILALCGCSKMQKGNSLQSFTHNINALGDYNMVNTGYIFNQKEKTLSKFYSFDGFNFLLDFSTDGTGNLTRMNIIFGKLSKNDTQEMFFIKNCMLAFINDEKKTIDLIEKSNLFERILTVSNETHRTEIGSIELLIDTTEKGIVITVVKNNL